jgi:serine protease
VSYYSNTGAQVAIAAPGGDMRFSTTGTGIADGVVSTVATFSDSGARVPTFAPLQGTSMATPHVAGVMALMRWVHPSITPAEVETLLAQGALTDEAGAAGRDADFGWGIVNAAKAVQAAITRRDGGPPPVTGGVVEAAPAALDFGTAATALEFTLRTTGATTEVVNTVTSNNAAITVTPVSIDGASKLGSYRVTVNRTALPNGVTTATVTATTSTARTLTVQVSVEKFAGGPAAADAGPVYVLVIDAASNEVLAQADVQASGGRYVWSTPGIRATSIVVVAGTDYDNDGFICARGEACGAFPVLGVNITPIRLTANRNDLDFLLAPVGTGNAQSAGATPKVEGATTVTLRRRSP